MQIKIIQTEEEFVSLQADWSRLSVQAFRSWDWNYCWWKHFGRTNQLCIVTAMEADRIVGIAPFQWKKRAGEKCLEFFGGGNVCTDYLQLIVEEGFEESFWNKIAVELNNPVSPLHGTSLIEFEGSGLDSTLMGGEGLEGKFWYYLSELNSTWVIPLPDSWDKFVATRNKSLRRKIKKAEKRFESGEAVVKTTANDLTFDSAFKTLVELHQDRFVSKGEEGVFSDETFTSFLRQATKRLVADGRAEILQCVVNDEPIVTQLYWLNENGPQLYQSGIRVDSMRYEPGHLLFTYAIKKAIEKGFPEFDFLRGNESYKSFWGAKQVPLFHARFVSHRLLSTLKHQFIKRIMEAKQWIKDSPLMRKNGMAGS